jgi:VanZ family protein
MKSKRFWWALVVIWCGLIFYQSSRDAAASSVHSTYIMELLNRWISALLGPGVFAVPEWAVRKAAHCFEYAVLGALLFAGFFNSSRIAKTVSSTFAAGVLYAISDEVHQHFVPGRTARFADVVIDTAGISIAVFVMWMFTHRRNAG